MYFFWKNGKKSVQKLYWLMLVILFFYKNDNLICILQYVFCRKHYENTKKVLIFLYGSYFLSIKKFPKKFHSNRTKILKVSFRGGWGGKKGVVKKSEKKGVNIWFQYLMQVSPFLTYISSFIKIRPKLQKLAYQGGQGGLGWF